MDISKSRLHIICMEQKQFHTLLVEAKNQFGARAMWWMRADADLESHWRVIVRALKTNGGHAGMILADKIEEAAHAPNRVSA